METLFFDTSTVAGRARLVVGLLLWSFYEDLAKAHLLVRKALPSAGALWLVSLASVLALR